MKVSSWQGVIISWANALRLLDEPVCDVLDLVKGSFFVKLLRKTRANNEDDESDVSQDDVYSVIENFLKDEFSNFRLLGYWDNDEVTLVASVLLLWSSLESQSLRTPLYELDNALQLKIQAFIQSFIETPRYLVNRQLVTDAVLEITSDNETDDEGSSFVSSPRTYSTPKRTSLNSSYSPALLALSEMRSLRNKVDLLNCEKHHLQEELELAKSQLLETKAKLEQKEADLIKLNSCFISGKDDEIDDQHTTISQKAGGDSSKNSFSESSVLKVELEELKDIIANLRQDLESTLEENSNLIEKLESEKLLRAKYEHKCIELEANNVNLDSKVQELENLVVSLKNTCEEQGVILAERTKIPVDDESFQLRDCESLGGIVDIKYSELQEQLKIQTELLEERSKEVKDLQDAQASAEKTIVTLQNEIDILKNDLSSCKTNQDCQECLMLKENFSSLQGDFCRKCDECSQLKEELNRRNNQIKVLMSTRTFDENRIADLKEKMNKLMNDYNTKCDEYKEEIIALKCELCEKSNAIEFYKDETYFLNSCLEDKKMELKSLENDHEKINLSKDKEIAQLMKSVEHLNKEVRRLQEQLNGECVRNDQLFHSAYQWRQKVSHGNTANEELARELIALHESLEWKTLKLADLSDQIDQLKCEMADKDALNKELHERLLFLSEKNIEVNRELQISKNNVVHLQSKITNMEFTEKRLNHEIVKKIKKFEIADNELKELRKVLREKFLKIDLELDSCIFRGNPSLQDIIEFIDFIREKFKENKKNISHLSDVINDLEAENAEKTADLEIYMCKVDELAAVNGSNTIMFWKKENAVFQDKLKKIESDYENNMIKLQDTLKKLEQANESLNTKNKIILELEAEVKKLKQELKTKQDVVDYLQQNVNLYEHEKHILERRITNLSTNDTGKSDSVEGENAAVLSSGKEDTQCLDGENNGFPVVKQPDFDEKLKNAVEERIVDLQKKMKAEFEEELKKTVEEYSKKIEQLKGKVKKDCLHIEHLSSELWETSDRLLLAQQETDALRSQLRKTRTMLSEQQLSNKGVQDSHSFMWLGGMDAGNYVNEFVTVTTKRTFETGKFTSEGNVFDIGHEDDEDFNEQCLEDLKAGICRLPSPIDRLSCPAESTRREDDCMPPPEKPRKLKGSITYRKPGPPTPSINAARHSLPGNEKLELRRGLREQNGNVSNARSRLSQLFGSIHLTKTKTIQESPKTKRKGFFQRTFGNRENLPLKS